MITTTTTTTTTTRQTLPLLLLLLLWTAFLAHGSPVAAPSAPRRALSPAAQATPTTAPRLPYPIPDTYNGTAFGRRPPAPSGTGAARATGGFLPPPPPARVTAAPGQNDSAVAAAAAHKDIPFIQTTYWSCVQWPTTVHCGWHEPILAVGDAAVAAAPGGPQGMAAAAGAARRALVVAGAGLLAGFLLGFV